MVQSVVMFVFSRHNYLGPGNLLNKGEPINSDDYFVPQQNLEYRYATNSDDVGASDKQAKKLLSVKILFRIATGATPSVSEDLEQNTE